MSTSSENQEIIWSTGDPVWPLLQDNQGRFFKNMEPRTPRVLPSSSSLQIEPGHLHFAVLAPVRKASGNHRCIHPSMCCSFQDPSSAYHAAPFHYKILQPQGMLRWGIWYFCDHWKVQGSRLCGGPPGRTPRTPGSRPPRPLVPLSPWEGGAPQEAALELLSQEHPVSCDPRTWLLPAPPSLVLRQICTKLNHGKDPSLFATLQKLNSHEWNVFLRLLHWSGHQTQVQHASLPSTEDLD